MDASPTLSRPRAPHEHLVRIVPRAESKVAEAPSGTKLALAAEAAWLGLASGWISWAVVFGHRLLVGNVTRVSVRLNWHHVAMGMVAHLAIFAVWLALTWPVESFRGKAKSAGRWVSVRFGWLLAFLSACLAIEELHKGCALVLAAGLASRVGPLWDRVGREVVRKTLLPLGIGSGLVAGLSFGWVQSAESRAVAALPVAEAGSPNIVLVVLDTVRADHLSLYGYARPTSPNMEALARRGITFDFARSAAPWTLPSHVAMFTGHLPSATSAETDKPLDSTLPTIAEHLADRGYLNGGFVGNTFYCSAWFGLDRGFAYYEAAEENRSVSVQETLRSSGIGRALMTQAARLKIFPTNGNNAREKSAEELNRDALAWIDGRGDRPFFLFLNYFDAHGPYTGPEGMERVWSKSSRSEIFEVNRLAYAQENLRIAAGSKGPGWDAALSKYESIAPDAYDDCIRYVDAQLGRLVDELARRGLDRNTWLIVTADHGEHFGEHGHYWHGSSLYRPVIDVPLLIVPPVGTPSGTRIPAPVGLRDLAATLADLSGSDSAPFPGCSLRRYWEGDLSTDDEPPLSELRIPGDSPQLRAFKDRYQTAIVDDGRIYHRSPIGSEELYRADDRGEAINLAPLPEWSAAVQSGREATGRVRGPSTPPTPEPLPDPTPP